MFADLPNNKARMFVIPKVQLREECRSDNWLTPRGGKNREKISPKEMEPWRKEDISSEDKLLASWGPSPFLLQCPPGASNEVPAAACSQVPRGTSPANTMLSTPGGGGGGGGVVAAALAA